MDFALYIHWPFCVSKCPYCDFNSHVREEIDEARWKNAYLRELAYWKAQRPDGTVTSVFFGGGTPSLMDPETAGAIIDEARRLWRFKNDVEITLEANPSSVETGRFQAFKEAGVGRVSIGVQSLRDEVLKFLERPHSADEARKAIETASGIFDRYSFDLIYGRPQQELSAWHDELQEALPLTRGHLSAYQLTIEPNTNFATRFSRGDFIMPDEETQAAFLETTIDLCDRHGLLHYEVSNFAAVGQESRHNLTYWRMGDYIGVGPGAHGRVRMNGTRYASVAHRAPEVWLERVEQSGHGHHPLVALSPREEREESVMMGLRIAEGVAAMPDLAPKARVLAEEGYLVSGALPERLVATRKGYLCLNAVTTHLLT